MVEPTTGFLLAGSRSRTTGIRCCSASLEASAATGRSGQLDCGSYDCLHGYAMLNCLTSCGDESCHCVLWMVVAGYGWICFWLVVVYSQGLVSDLCSYLLLLAPCANRRCKIPMAKLVLKWRRCRTH